MESKCCLAGDCENAELIIHQGSPARYCQLVKRGIINLKKCPEGKWFKAPAHGVPDWPHITIESTEV